MFRFVFDVDTGQVGSGLSTDIYTYIHTYYIELELESPQHVGVHIAGYRFFKPQNSGAAAHVPRRRNELPCVFDL